MKRVYWLLHLFLPIFLQAQEDAYHIFSTDQPIKIDGIIDEEVWGNVQVIKNFKQYFPSDSTAAESTVEIRMTYDEIYLYVSAKMYNLTEDREYAVPSLRRDYRGNFDGITIEIDPFQDNTNAFQFGINPFGVQREGLISNGGVRGDDLALSWDNKWLAEAKQYPGFWVAEAAIPFKTLRFKPGNDRWNINFYRIDTEQGERSTWTHIPRNFLILSLAFMKELVWDKPLEKSGPNISLIPYVSASTQQNNEAIDPDRINDFSYGGDAKIAVSPSLNLDLTFNPDFSQVELDQQVTDLNRFELFFPERRQFFLENADLFESFGHPFYSRPFFSRRIGIARDESTGQNIQNQIYAGARLSGKLDNNWRIGILNMQAAEDEAINLPGINYTVGAIQRKIFGRSNIGAIFVNKQAFESYAENDTTPYGGWNRLAGIDYNIASSNGRWNGKVMYHHSFDEGGTKPKQGSHTGFIGYSSKKWIGSWAHVYVGENHNAEVGFVPRPGIFRINPDFGRNFFPSKGFINSIELKVETEYIWTVDGQKTDHKYAINMNSGLSNTGRMSASIEQNHTFLIDPFDPTQTDGRELEAMTGYTYHNFNFSYISDQRKLFNYQINGYLGEYFNGNRQSLGANLGYRFQPILDINVNVVYNRIRLPADFNDADLWLLGPRFDLTLTKSIFFTNFIQYNSQIDNININSRFQWRFAPVSDLFIVYTDNYGTEQFSDIGLRRKNHALILKMTYWINL